MNLQTAQSIAASGLIESLAEELKEIIKEHNDRIIRVREVMEMVNIRRNSLLDLVNSGHFPKPIPISKTINGWRLSDVQEFIRIGGIHAWAEQYGKTNNVRLAA
ncbi:helix-turn-helix transcriptional regulator [Algicola sagamiensis]|uniref:helix-turn-helix transcriptional regulator n=1 Tax=Algicola sagamiensis TaxID=163869 RepID=UPI000373400E|nr:AlpA family phage regulatory protein [Algicola sagamiensis]